MIATPLHEVYFRTAGTHLQAHGALEEIRRERTHDEARKTSYELIELSPGRTAGIARSVDKARLTRLNPGLQCIPVQGANEGEEVNFAFALAMPRERKKRLAKPTSDVQYLIQTLNRHGLVCCETGCRRLRLRLIPLKSSSEKKGFTGVVVDFLVAAQVVDSEKFQSFLAHGNKTLRGFGIGLPIMAGSALYAPFVSI